VKVVADLAGARGEGEVDAAGRWEVTLPALPPGGEHELRVTCDGDERVYREIRLGDLWLCSGQSNMEWTLAQLASGTATREAADDASIRFFRCEHRGYREEALPRGRWLPAVGEAAGDCSAVAYHFARHLRRWTDRPLGLIVNAIGGSIIESWMPAARSLRHDAGRSRSEAVGAPQAELRARIRDEHLPALRAWCEEAAAADGEAAVIPSLPEPRTEDLGWNPANQLGACWRSLVAPLAGTGLRGALWYQGESNAEAADGYADLLRELIGCWREFFADPGLPFLQVQLAGFSSLLERRRIAPGEPHDWGWPRLRAAQEAALDVPGTAMAVAIDVGDRFDIHPEDKAAVGERLALCAARRVYGADDVVDEGPRAESARRDGDGVVVRYRDGEALRTTDGADPRGFFLGTGDGDWHPAAARIASDEVRCRIPENCEPALLCYAWSGHQDVNLVGATGLPAWPARLPVG